MLKLLVAILAAAVVGSASAAGWRDLRVDGSSEAAFVHSLAAFKDKLSPTRRHVFGLALQDIWVAGRKAAEAQQREYTAGDYYAQLDGLGYEQVISLADPTGETTRARYREANLGGRGARYQASQRAARDTWNQERPMIDGPRGTPNTTVCPGGANGCQ
jgi:hypothetical protein